jgi:hypothetical protein
MKTTVVTVIAMLLLLTAGVFAQEKSAGKLAAADLIGALNGDTEKFERGMQTLESFLALNPKDPEAMVMHGNGVMARAGNAFQKGDMANAMKLWQSGLAEMAEAVQLASDNIYVRARRGVLLITLSRSTPPAMGKPLVELAVSDFEKVLQVREQEKTLAERSIHQRGELLTSLADGWDRIGNAEKARGYFERIEKDMKGTTYEQKAKAWLEGKPEVKTAEFFACTGCHVE